VTVVEVWTVVVVLPFETFTRTLVPGSTSAPAAGFWATTLPCGWLDGTSATSGLSPAFVSWATASLCERLIRFGTADRFPAAFLGDHRSLRLAAAALADGSLCLRGDLRADVTSASSRYPAPPGGNRLQ